MSKNKGKENEVDFGEFQEASPNSVGFSITTSGPKYKITFSERVPALEKALGPFYKNDSFSMTKANYDTLISFGLSTEKSLIVSLGSREVNLPGKFKLIKSDEEDVLAEGIYYPNKSGGRRKTRKLFRRRLTKKLTKRTK